MGSIERLRRWLRSRSPERAPPAYREPAEDDVEDEEIAELVAIGII